MMPLQWAFIAGGAVGAAVSWWVQTNLWWLVMYKSWVNAHEMRRRKRLRELQRNPKRRDGRGHWS